MAKLRESRAYSVLVRPSALSIAGASIGIVSILLTTWGNRLVLQMPLHPYPSTRVFWVTERLSFFDLMTMTEPTVVAALVVFLIGTALALFMPIFGFLQGLGVMGFILNYRSAFSESPQISELGLGYYLAVISTIVVIMSCKVTYGLPVVHRPIPVALRIAALSPYSTRLRR